MEYDNVKIAALTCISYIKPTISYNVLKIICNNHILNINFTKNNFKQLNHDKILLLTLPLLLLSCDKDEYIIRQQIKMKLKIFLTLILLIVFLGNSLNLIPKTTIQSNYKLSNELKEEIKKASTKNKDYNYNIHAIMESSSQEYSNDLIEYCDFIESLVCSELSFSFKFKSERKVNEENCVGYAAMMTAACNYAFNYNGINAKAYHVRGDIQLFGFSLCKMLSYFGPFFKDHDFVIIKYGDKKLIYDPSFKDLVKF